MCVPQVRAAAPERQRVVLRGPVLLLPSAPSLPYLAQRHLRPVGHRNLHGAMPPRRHVSHVHGRHLGGLSHAAENAAGEVSECVSVWVHLLKISHLIVRWIFHFASSCVCRSVRFSAERSALSVVIYPLQHEDLPSVIRDIPLTLLDRITLFQSHVAQPPHLSPLWHQQKASLWLVLNSWRCSDWLLFLFSVGI